MDCDGRAKGTILSSKWHRRSDHASTGNKNEPSSGAPSPANRGLPGRALHLATMMRRARPHAGRALERGPIGFVRSARKTVSASRRFTLSSTMITKTGRLPRTRSRLQSRSADRCRPGDARESSGKKQAETRLSCSGSWPWRRSSWCGFRRDRRLNPPLSPSPKRPLRSRPRSQLRNARRCDLARCLCLCRSPPRRRSLPRRRSRRLLRRPNLVPSLRARSPRSA